MVTYNKVYDTYIQIARQHGKASCDAVAAALYEQGIKPHGYDQPYSRQRIRCILSSRPEGRALIQRKTKIRAVIVEKRLGVLAWLREHNLDGLEIIAPDKVSAADVKGAYVYGDVPISLAHMARSVWLVTTEHGVPVVADLSAAELNNMHAELREVRIKVIR